MPKPPSLRKSNPVLLRALGQAAVKAGTDHDEPRMKAAGERALRLAAKAVREGKAGTITDGESVAIVEQ